MKILFNEKNLMKLPSLKALRFTRTNVAALGLAGAFSNTCEYWPLSPALTFTVPGEKLVLGGNDVYWLFSIG